MTALRDFALAVKIVTISGGILFGSIAFVVLFLLFINNMLFALFVSFSSKPLILASTTSLFGGVKHFGWIAETVKYMNLANVVCFAILFVLVLIVSLVDEILFLVRSSLETKGKLPSTELLWHTNGNYDYAISRGSVAHKVKRLQRAE